MALPLSYTRKRIFNSALFISIFKWWVQDSNLRRLSHLIYSQTRLTASVTHRLSCRAIPPPNLPFILFITVSRSLKTSCSDRNLLKELAEGLEPTTC